MVAIEPGDNELITLEVIHRYVELLDKYFGNVNFLAFLSAIIFMNNAIKGHCQSKKVERCMSLFLGGSHPWQLPH